MSFCHYSQAGPGLCASGFVSKVGNLKLGRELDQWRSIQVGGVHDSG